MLQKSQVKGESTILLCHIAITSVNRMTAGGLLLSQRPCFGHICCTCCGTGASAEHSRGHPTSRQSPWILVLTLDSPCADDWWLAGRRSEMTKTSLAGTAPFLWRHSKGLDTQCSTVKMVTKRLQPLSHQPNILPFSHSPAWSDHQFLWKSLNKSKYQDLLWMWSLLTCDSLFQNICVNTWRFGGQCLLCPGFKVVNSVWHSESKPLPTRGIGYWASSRWLAVVLFVSGSCQGTVKEPAPRFAWAWNEAKLSLTKEYQLYKRLIKCNRPLGSFRNQWDAFWAAPRQTDWSARRNQLVSRKPFLSIFHSI